MAGILLFVRPIEGMFVLSLMVAAAFLAEGILEAISILGLTSTQRMLTIEFDLHRHGADKFDEMR